MITDYPTVKISDEDKVSFCLQKMSITESILQFSLSEYVKCLEQLFEANNNVKERHVATLLSVMGATTYGLQRIWCSRTSLEISLRMILWTF